MNRLGLGLLLGLVGLLLGIGLGVARPWALVLDARPIASPPIATTAPPQLQSNAQANASLNRSPGSSPIVAPLVAPLWPKVQVDPQQLLTDLAAIEGERLGQVDRAKTRQYLGQRLRSLNWQVSEQSFAQGVNLVAILPGSQPTWVVGAHYDTVSGSPGADDNGTGVAALLALAEGYAQTTAPIELVFFDQEEQGLLGSLAYVERLRLTGRSTGSEGSIRGAIILDMIGSACYQPGCQRYPEGLVESLPKSMGTPPNQGDFIAVIGEAERPDLLRAFTSGPRTGPNRSDPAVLTVPVPFKGILTPDVLRSDHSPFWLQNIGAVLVTDTANLRNPHYHRNSDRLDTVDPAFFAGVTQRVAHAVGQLISQP